MSVFLTKADWDLSLKGELIVDIALRDKSRIYVCSRKKVPHAEASLLMEGDIPSRITGIYLANTNGKTFGSQQIEGMMYTTVGVSRTPFEKPTGLMASRNSDGDVWPHGSAGNGPLEYIAKGKWPGADRLKCIDGFTYSVGGNREIYKRVAVGRWEPFVREGLIFSGDLPGIQTMSTSRLLDVTSAMGFNDLDAFSASDMYAVGGHGDIWHFDGTRWQKMGFPSNVQLGTVTCAGDGNVYVSGEGGSLWVGQRSTWRRVYEGSSSILWNDVLWFNGQLWLASDYQFRIWDGKEMLEVTHEGKSVSMYGHMDAYDGILAIASPEWVKTFDGKEWRTIVAPYLT
jgi:hypothetical protein